MVWYVNVILAIAILLVPIILLGFSLGIARRRRNHLREAALRQGFTPRGPFSATEIQQFLSDFDLIARASRRHFSNVMYRVEGHHMLMLSDLQSADGPMRPGMGLTSQTILLLVADRPLSGGPVLESAETTIRPLAHDHRAWIQRIDNRALFYIGDHLVEPHQIERLVMDGRKAAGLGEQSPRVG